MFSRQPGGKGAGRGVEEHRLLLQRCCSPCHGTLRVNRHRQTSSAPCCGALLVHTERWTVPPRVGRDGPVTSLWQERDPRCCRVLPAMPGAQPLSWELLPALQHSPHPSFCTWPAAVPWHEAPPTQNAVLAALRTPGRVYEQQGSALHCMEQQKSEPGPRSRAARQQLQLGTWEAEGAMEENGPCVRA